MKTGTVGHIDSAKHSLSEHISKVLSRKFGTCPVSYEIKKEQIMSNDNQDRGSVFLANLAYFFAKTDGIYEYPNSAVGDLLKQAKKEIEAARAVAQNATLDEEKTYKIMIDRVCLTAAEIHQLGEYVSDEKAQSLINKIRNILESNLIKK